MKEKKEKKEKLIEVTRLKDKIMKDIYIVRLIKIEGREA